MKKNKVFSVLIGVFALAFVAGVGLCVKEFLSISEIKTTIEKTEKSLKRLVNRGSEPALTEKNLVAGKANAEKLKEAVNRKTVAIKGRKGDSLIPKTDGDGGDFTSSLRGDVAARVQKLTGEKIILDDDAKFFGFSRYIGGTQEVKPAQDLLQLLGIEQKVIQELTDKLVDARQKTETSLRSLDLLPPDKRSFLWIKGIRREAAELPKKDGAMNTVVNKDEIAVSMAENSADTGLYRLVSSGNSRGTAFPSLRKPGVVDAVAFQVGFVAPTSVLRDFITAFSVNGDFPIYIRDVAVLPVDSGNIEAKKNELNPPPESLATQDAAPAATNDFDIFGGASVEPEAPASASVASGVPAKSVVLPESLAEFWVTLEYVTPVKPSVPAEEKDEEE